MILSDSSRIAVFRDVTGVVLAGGESRRMGRDKAAISFFGASTVERMVKLFTGLFPEVIVVTKVPGRFSGVPCREIKDIYADKGPMVGVLTALYKAEREYIFAAACDMPFLEEEAVSLVVERGRGFDVAVPEAGGMLHPLFGLYSKRCIEEMRDCLERGDRSLGRFIRDLSPERVRIIGEEEMRAADPSILTLFNMNTPEELEKAKELMKKRERGGKIR